MNMMRKYNPALFSPEKGAPLERIACDNEAIFACRRRLVEGKKMNEVMAVMNMSDKPQEVTLETGETYDLEPWRGAVSFSRGRGKKD